MTTEPVASWLEAQLRDSIARVDALSRDVAYLQSALTAREREVMELRDSLAIVDGRTRRHETAQDAVRALQQALATLEARLGDEGELRRDQGAVLERAGEQERELQRAVEAALAGMAARLGSVEQAVASAGARQAQLAGDLAGREQDDARIAGRLAALGDEVEALAQAERRDADSTARMADAVAALQLVSRVIETRTQQLQQDQQRVEDDLVVLGRLAEREESLSEVLEQQRTLRQHIEERLALLDERAASADAAQATETESRALLRQRLDRLEASVTALGVGVEAQREALLEHFRRATIAAEAAGRRQADEIDRQARAARELLVRLAEGAEQATREQPL